MAINRSLEVTEDLLRRGLNVRISTLGTSMFPLIGAGDQITISPDKNPEIGDVIVFRNADSIVCHRLVKIFAQNGAVYYQSRGDSFFSPDAPVSRGDLLGKVITIDRKSVSFTRKVLLLIFPFLHRNVNTAIVAGLVNLKRACSRQGRETQ